MDSKLRPEFLIERDGRKMVLYAGLLSLAHECGLKSITVSLVQVPNDSNGLTAICQATVELVDKDGGMHTFTEIGDAAPHNVSRMMVPHTIRMAATRSKARALRDAVNIGMTALEELGDDNHEPAPPPRRPTPQRPAAPPALSGQPTPPAPRPATRAQPVPAPNEAFDAERTPGEYKALRQKAWAMGCSLPQEPQSPAEYLAAIKGMKTQIAAKQAEAQRASFGPRDNREHGTDGPPEDDDPFAGMDEEAPPQTPQNARPAQTRSAGSPAASEKQIATIERMARAAHKTVETDHLTKAQASEIISSLIAEMGGKRE